MNPTIETLKGWSAAYAAVEKVEETDVFNLLCYTDLGIPDVKPWDDDRPHLPCWGGTAKVTRRYFVVGEQQIPVTEKPQAWVEFHTHSPHGTKLPYLHLLGSCEVAEVQEGLDGRVYALVIEQEQDVINDSRKHRWILYTDVLTKRGEESRDRGESLCGDQGELPWSAALTG